VLLVKEKNMFEGAPAPIDDKEGLPLEEESMEQDPDVATAEEELDEDLPMAA